MLVILSSLAALLASIWPLRERGHVFAHTLVIDPISIGAYEAIIKEKRFFHIQLYKLMPLLFILKHLKLEF